VAELTYGGAGTIEAMFACSPRGTVNHGRQRGANGDQPFSANEEAETDTDGVRSAHTSPTETRSNAAGSAQLYA
jgi:hypothetical protein